MRGTILLSFFVVHLILVIGDSEFSHDAVTSANQEGEQNQYARVSKIPRVLLVSIDGFRYDFLKMMSSRGTPLRNLERLAYEGVYASMKPQFPSETFVNHVTMMTGLHPTAHGVVSNVYYDAKLNSSFDPVHHFEQWFDDRYCASYASVKGGGEPLWFTNERQRSPSQPFRRSGVHMWPCSYRFRGAQPTAFESRFDNEIPFQARIDRVLGWYLGEDVPEAPNRLAGPPFIDGTNTKHATSADSSGQAVNFAALYFEHIDETAHSYGPESPEVAAALLELDADIGYLIERVAAIANRVAALDHVNGVALADDYGSDWLNLVIVSDHGFATVNSTDPARTFSLGELLSILGSKIDNSVYTKASENRITIDSFSDLAPFAALYNVDLFDSVTGQPYSLTESDLVALNNVNPLVHVYRVTPSTDSNFTVPDEYRFSAAVNSPASARLRSTLFLTEAGYMLANDYHYGENREPEHSFGTHGYNQSHPSMLSVFIARGPAFRTHLQAPANQPFENVDLYPLLCTILQLQAAPNNGSLERVAHLFAVQTEDLVQKSQAVEKVVSTDTKPDEKFSLSSSDIFNLASAVLLLALLAVGAAVLRHLTSSDRVQSSSADAVANGRNGNHEANNRGNSAFANAAYGDLSLRTQNRQRFIGNGRADSTQIRQ